MSEYWKSTPKYYCKVCNQWMADTKHARLMHEQGEKHKQRVEMNNAKKLKQKFDHDRNQRELAAAMRDMEKAARGAIEEDRDSYGQMFKSSSGISAPRPQISSTSWQQRDGLSGAKVSVDSQAPESLRREGDNGIYQIGRQTYLEGKLHEDKMRSDTACEIYVESVERWIPAYIENMNLVHVPNTDIVMKTFNVKYLYASEEEFEKDPSGGVETFERDIHSDRLRLLVDENLETKEIRESRESREQSEAEAKTYVDETTGIGAWCTVSVNVYNEEEEMERERKEAEDEEERRYKKLLGNAKGKSMLWGPEDDEEDAAMSVYDPNKTGMYKGFNIRSSGTSSSLAKEEEPRVELSKPGEKIGFKKRKGASGGGGRQIKKKSDDDKC